MALTPIVKVTVFRIANSNIWIIRELPIICQQLIFILSKTCVLRESFSTGHFLLLTASHWLRAPTRPCDLPDWI